MPLNGQLSNSFAGPASRKETRSARILPLSARSSEALLSLARKYHELLLQPGGALRFHDICYSASVKRSHLQFRLAAVAHDEIELAEKLAAFLQQKSDAGVYSGRIRHSQRVAFLFSEQGSHWSGMGRELLRREPLFAQALQTCDQIAREFIDWSLLEAIAGSPCRLADVECVEPVLFAVQMGLSTVWRAWGIEPGAVVGQGIGEIAAAYVAGLIGLRDALQVACRNGQALKRKRGEGIMAVVKRPVDELSSVLAGCGTELSIASINGPASTMVSGEPDALLRLLDELRRGGTDCALLEVDVALRSAQMDEPCEELREALSGLQGTAGSIPFYSTVTGQVCNGSELNAEYWVSNLRKPALFSIAIEKLLADGYDIFLEVAPAPTWLDELSENYGGRSKALCSVRRHQELPTMLASLAALYTLGLPVEWSKVYSSGGRFVELPLYPWQRQRFWDLDQEASRERMPAVEHVAGRGRLLGDAVSAITVLTAVPERRQQAAEEYLAHQVAGVLKLPTSSLDLTLPVNQLGLDSLVAVELKNQIEVELGVVIPTLEILRGVSIRQLAGEIVSRMASTRDAQPITGGNQGTNARHLLDRLDQMTEEEANAMLSGLTGLPD
jgi:acyl transferase domain-containing protein